MNEELTAVKRALHLACGDICRGEEEDDEKTSGISISASANKNNNNNSSIGGGDGGKIHARMSKKGIAALTELTFHYAKNCLAKDLILFSQHANRKTIKVADVKLIARRNPRGLLTSLESFCDNQSLNAKEKKSNHQVVNYGSNNKKKKRSRIEAFLDDDSDDDDDDGDGADDNNADSSSNDGLGLGLGESYEDSNAAINFDIQVDESSSSSSSSSQSNISDDESIPRKKSAAERIQDKIAKKKRMLMRSLSSEDEDDDKVSFTTDKNQETEGVQTNAAIEILDDDESEGDHDG